MVHPSAFAFASVPALLLVPCAAQSLIWRPVDVTSHAVCAVVFDTARERFVAVSGARTMEWDGATWQLRAELAPPPPRLDAALVYDRARQRTLMLGGRELQNGSFALAASAWQYDGSRWAEVVAAPGPQPPPRVRHALGYDSARDRVVLFGGQGAGFLDDTWEWDGVAWQQIAAPQAPSARAGAAMAFHAPSGRMILFGGVGTAPASADTWAWDGVTWTQLAPATVPPARHRHLVSANDAHGVVVMHSGQDPMGATLQDTWRWNGTDWLAGPTVAPSLRSFAGMATGSSGDTIVVGGVFAVHHPGGVYESATLGDTWRYPGGVQPWTRIDDTGPPYRNHPYVAYDSLRDRLVLAGGSTGTVHSTWEWDGWSWTKHSPAQELPMLLGSAVAFDRARGVTVAFGGVGVSPIAASNRVYEWDGFTWHLRQVVGPSPRHQHAMVYDHARGVMVVFGGGAFLGDTWTWDGGTWTLAATTGPSGRILPAMAYDEARARVVLFGGSDPVQLLDDTWEWDGVAWQQRFPAHSPSPRFSALCAYDPLFQRTILLGGHAQVSPTQRATVREVWEWDGVDWVGGRAAVPIDPTNSPLGFGAMAWHDRLHGMALVATAWAAGAGASSDLWLGSVLTAFAHPIGDGCAGASTPRLRTLGAPSLGNARFGLDVEAAPANGLVVVAYASGAGAVPLGGGCTLRLAGGLAAFGAITNAHGFVHQQVSIPVAPQLLGADLFAQAVAVDSTAPLGLGLTNALQLRLGH